MHLALVDARAFARSGDADRLVHLTDMLHVIPSTTPHWGEVVAGESAENYIHSALSDYEDRFPDAAGRYTGILRPAAASTVAQAA